MTEDNKDTAPNKSDKSNTSNEKNASSSGGGGSAWFALLLSLAALAAAGYSSWQVFELRGASGRQSDDASSRVQKLSTDLGGRIAALDRGAAERSEALADMQVALEQSVSVLSDLPGRVEQLEAQVESIPGIKDSSRVDFLKAEAIYYMRIANAQALLAREPQVAADALQLADEKLRDTGDPGLAKVREQLNSELAALRGMPEVDRAGISFKLQSLASEVSNWPFRNQAPSRFASELPDPADDEETSADPWERVETVVADVFGSIVSVRETDVAPELQLGSAEQAIVVESVRAELQLARLGIISGNDELFGQALQRVAEQASSYFDPESTSVQAALTTLQELAALEMPGALPDVSGSLQLMLGEASDEADSAGDAP